MIWFLNSPERLQYEVEEIESLARASSWLVAFNWRIDDGNIVCDADVEIDSRRFPLMLRYNQSFPRTPISVIPRVKEHWSSHQYGVGGELCLEYGTDNWHSSKTGADMLVSAFKLLSEEKVNVAGEIPTLVLSRHHLTLGQEMRHCLLRAFFSTDFYNAAKTVENIAEIKLKFRSGNNEETNFILWPSSIEYPDGTTWRDLSIPQDIELMGFEYTVGFAKCQDEFELDNYKTPDELMNVLFGHSVVESERKKYSYILILWKENILFLYMNRENNSVFQIPTIPPKSQNRLSQEYVALAEKKVGIVGCGSVGSKIAAMLTRSGVGKFILVDDDIFSSENLVRNELDWRAVGEHKVDALSRHLKLLNSSVEIIKRKHRMGGQEANSSLHSLIGILQTCDLVVDATATGEAFNYICAATTDAQKPMIWAEVFAGGIGGIVARSRPGYEPEPQEARSQILHWCKEKNKPVPFTTGINYEGGDADPFVADDADVTVIASHAARLAIDTLLTEGENSSFPQSAYVIGLRKGWIFNQPFETHPINFVLTDAEDIPNAEHVEKRKIGFEKIAEMVSKLSDAETTD